MEGGVRRSLPRDRRAAVGAHVPAAQRAGDVTGVDLDAVAECRQPLERFEQVAGAFARGHREVGARRIADEQRVAGERDLLVDHERAVLRPVARRVQDTQPCLAHRQLLAVCERLERVLRVGDRVDRDRKTVLEGEPSVAGDVVGVRVRLEHPFDPQTLPGRGCRRTARSGRTGRRPRPRLRCGRRSDTRHSRDPRPRIAGRGAPTSSVTAPLAGALGCLAQPSPRCLAITIRCTSLVPSPISRIFWSR